VISDLHQNYSNIRVIVISDITDFFKILQDLVEKALKQVAEKKADLEKHLEEKVFFFFGYMSAGDQIQLHHSPL
jgi:hypothetical protein